MIPTTLINTSSIQKAIEAFITFQKSKKGDVRSLSLEIKDNLTYLNMVTTGDMNIEGLMKKLSMVEYQRLSKEGFDYNLLKKSKIENYQFLKGTSLSSWKGKKTEILVVSIYDKISELNKIFTHAPHSNNYRLSVRIINIQRRILLLLEHIRN
jgi:hypothetical protein